MGNGHRCHALTTRSAGRSSAWSSATGRASARSSASTRRPSAKKRSSAAAGQRPAMPFHRRLDPLPHQVAAHRQPGAAPQRDPHPCGPSPRAGHPGEQQRHAVRADQQVGQPFQGVGRHATGQVQNHGVDAPLAGQPAGQLHRLGDIGRADDQQPVQVDAQPCGGRRIQVAGSVQVGDQPTRRLAGGQRTQRQGGGAAARWRIEQRQGAARPAAGAQCGIQPGMAGGDGARPGDRLRHRSGKALAQAMRAQRFEQFGKGLDHGHGPAHVRTSVLVWEAPNGPCYTRRRPDPGVPVGM